MLRYSRSFQRGITLMELLVVLGICAAMMSLGAAAYIRSSSRMREEGAAAQLEIMLRAAHNSGPSFVTIDTETDPVHPKIMPWTYKVVGQWNFDGGKITQGALGLDGFNRGCVSVEGKFGNGIAFGTGAPQNGGAYSGFLDLGSNADFDMKEGGWIEAWIMGTMDWSGGQFIFNKKGCYSLSVDVGGYLVGQAGSDRIKVREYSLPLRRWTKVAFAWDKYSSRIFIDDALYAVGPGMTANYNPSESLLFGDDNNSLMGRGDEVKIMTVFSGKALNIPPHSKIVHDTAPWNAVFFAPDGSLDMNYHTGPVYIDVISPESKKRRIYVSMLGATKRGEVEKMPKLEEDEEVLADMAAAKPRPVVNKKLDPKKPTIKVPPPPPLDMDDDMERASSKKSGKPGVPGEATDPEAPSDTVVPGGNATVETAP